MKKLLFLAVFFLCNRAFGADRSLEEGLDCIVRIAEHHIRYGDIDEGRQVNNLAYTLSTPEDFFKRAYNKQQAGSMGYATKYYQMAAFKDIPHSTEQDWLDVMRDDPVVPVALNELCKLYTFLGHPADAQVCFNLRQTYFERVADQLQHQGIHIGDLVLVSEVYEKELKGLL